ncbi:MAG TPA: hypothetical protein VNH18_06430, partial [Bryobacteraceae bacterium]|nr:hypothetical protein [Bryobacteraceae bacterium]
TVWAMKAGKDVYCEKPACYNIHEGQVVVQTAHDTQRMVQVGSQHRSTPFKINGMKLIKDGIIGKVYMSKGLCYKRRVSIGHKENQPTPAGVNWDLFLGPAPMRPFNELRFKYNWHWFWDTGNGDIGNQGVHEMGLARWAMGDPAWPKTAISYGGKYGPDDDQETPNTQTAAFDFGGRQLVFEVRGGLTGSEGSTPPPGKNAPPRTSPEIHPMTGNLVYGTEGWMSMSDAGFQIYKGEGSELVTEEKASGGDQTKAHMENFLGVVRSRKYADLHDGIENAVLSAGLVHLANISYRSGHKLTLDNGPKFVGDAEANKLITRPVYRKGYEV